jgi:hypothetical protein
MEISKVLEAISNDNSKLIGQGEWYKDSCYQVHEVEGSFYAIVVTDQCSMWLVNETLEKIKEEDINDYI